MVAVLAAVIAVRGVGHGWTFLERSLETSGQLAIRMAVVTIFALGTLAASLGLDLLLGGFVAGVIVRLALKGREVQLFESKLTAVGYGFFIPFFFVVSGIQFDLDALLDDPVTLLELPLYLALFLVVRGVPALLLYRGELERRGQEGARHLLFDPAADGRGYHHHRRRRRDTCVPRRPRRWWAPRSCPRPSSRSSACGCARGQPPRTGDADRSVSQEDMSALHLTDKEKQCQIS